MELPVGVVVVVRRPVGQTREVQRSVRRVDDGDINGFKRLTAPWIVSRDFNVIGVRKGRATKRDVSVNIDVGCLVNAGKDLQGFNV